MVGQGRAPILRATYIELVVMIIDPSAPMTRLLTVNCFELPFSSDTSVLFTLYPSFEPT